MLLVSMRCYTIDVKEGVSMAERHTYYSDFTDWKQPPGTIEGPTDRMNELLRSQAAAKAEANGVPLEATMTREQWAQHLDRVRAYGHGILEDSFPPDSVGSHFDLPHDLDA
jgi:hypothetical protein